MPACSHCCIVRTWISQVASKFRDEGTFYDIFVLLSWHIIYNVLFFSADRCVGSAATVAGLTFWSSVEAENRDPGQTGARLLSWNLGYFYNESKLKNLVYVLLCRWGLWNTAIVVGPAIQLSPIAIELHRSRHSPWYSAFRSFSCCAGKAWSLAL